MVLQFYFCLTFCSFPWEWAFFPQRHAVDSEALLPGPCFSLQTNLPPNTPLTVCSSCICIISVPGAKPVLCLPHTFAHVVSFPGKSLLPPYPRLLLSYCFLRRVSSGFLDQSSPSVTFHIYLLVKYVTPTVFINLTRAKVLWFVQNSTLLPAPGEYPDTSYVFLIYQSILKIEYSVLTDILPIGLWFPLCCPTIPSCFNVTKDILQKF